MDTLKNNLDNKSVELLQRYFRSLIETYRQGLLAQDPLIVNASIDIEAELSLLKQANTTHLAEAYIRSIRNAAVIDTVVRAGMIIPVIGTNAVVLFTEPKLSPMFLLLEGSPGGLASIYAAGYFLITMGIPALLSPNLTRQEKTRALMLCAATSYDGGYIAAPLVRIAATDPLMYRLLKFNARKSLQNSISKIREFIIGNYQDSAQYIDNIMYVLTQDEDILIED